MSVCVCTQRCLTACVCVCTQRCLCLHTALPYCVLHVHVALPMHCVLRVHVALPMHKPYYFDVSTLLLELSTVLDRAIDFTSTLLPRGIAWQNNILSLSRQSSGKFERYTLLWGMFITSSRDRVYLLEEVRLAAQYLHRRLRCCKCPCRWICHSKSSRAVCVSACACVWGHVRVCMCVGEHMWV